MKTNLPPIVKSIVFALAAVLPVITFAQNAQTEINEQVWKPFIKGFTTGDAALFLSVHSKQLVRSPRDDQQVYGWDEYLQQTKEGNEWRSSRKIRLDIELRFTERIAQGDLAIEVGIYKTTSTEAGGAPRSFYGRFHVVERRENGIWKIIVDTDSSEGGTIGEKEFLAAKPMEP